MSRVTLGKIKEALNKSLAAQIRTKSDVPYNKFIFLSSEAHQKLDQEKRFGRCYSREHQQRQITGTTIDKYQDHPVWKMDGQKHHCWVIGCQHIAAAYRVGTITEEQLEILAARKTIIDGV